MSYGFSSPILEVATDDGRECILLREARYTAADGTVYVMPKGARADGCSTPKELWPFLPPFGQYWKAAYLHDCAYRNTLLRDNGDLANLTREQCDNLFKEAMQSMGVPESIVDKIYWGVSIGGWKAFDKDRGQ